jgi:hypothetical protein
MLWMAIACAPRGKHVEPIPAAIVLFLFFRAQSLESGEKRPSAFGDGNCHVPNGDPGILWSDARGRTSKESNGVLLAVVYIPRRSPARRTELSRVSTARSDKAKCPGAVDGSTHIIPEN